MQVFEAGAEIAIATPGRMIDMIKMKVSLLPLRLHLSCLPSPPYLSAALPGD